MLIFGSAVGDWKEKARYATDKADNDFAKVREIRCDGIDDVQTAFASMAASAVGSNCKNFLYHATLNLNPGERLTEAQWNKAIDQLEKNLNLTDHYRVVFEHIKKNRQHYHIIWSRIPPEGDGAAVTMSNNYYVHQNTAKALEKEFGLKPAPQRDKSKSSHKRQERKDSNARIRQHPDAVTAEVTKIFKNSRTSREFIQSLAKSGYVLTRGRNSSYVLVDKQGGYHGLLRRIQGVRLEDLRKKFPDLDKTPLPSLNSVLNGRRPASKHSFRHVSRLLSSKRRFYKPRISGTVYRPRAGSFTPLIVQARARHIKRERKYYPLPLMRKQQRKKDENKPIKNTPSRAEIENAKLLSYAWEHGRLDILAQFGIFLPPDTFDL